MRSLLVLCFLVTTARADQWVTPTAVSLTSPNGKIHGIISPAADGKSGATAVTGDKTAPRRFALQNKWMPVDALLFDDGSLLTLDEWHSLGYGDVATLYGRDGKVKWTKTLVQLIGQTGVDNAQHSVSSIWWRKRPLSQTLSKDGKSIRITLHDENELELRLADGSAKLIAVPTLPDDPARLLNRARTLRFQKGREREAVALLERAIAKDPDQLEAIWMYAETLAGLGDHARAVGGLEQMAKKWTVKDGYNVANIYVAWSKSYVALKQPAEAERVLRLAVAAAPTYVNPTVTLSTLLFDQKRRADADKVLDDFVARLFKAPSLDTYGLKDIAEAYKQRGDRTKALAIYLRGYKPDQVTNQFLYADLAKLYEEMTDIPRAIKIHEQLLAYFIKMGSAFDMYAKTEREALVRLRARP